MVLFVVVAAILVGAVGLVIGIFLGVASEKFKVEVDEREAKVRDCLPGNNCGACGFPGCDGCAKAIASGEAAVTQCPVGGAAVAEKIYGSDFALLYSEALEGVDGNVDVDAARCVVEVDGDEQSLVLVASQICELAMWIEVAIVHIHQVEECTFGDGSLVVADE